MFYGLPVIAGNTDGSADALLNGELGLLIEPENPEAIVEAIGKIILKRPEFIPDHSLLMENFGYESYKKKLASLLNTGNDLKNNISYYKEQHKAGA